MARQEADREDLWSEIRALSPRLEIAGPGLPDPVIAGFREATGGWSIFFGQNRVWHFDAQGRLRRAYVDGALYRTQGTTLARLVRRRTETEVELERPDLDARELGEMLAAMRDQVSRLLSGLHGGSLRAIRQEPPGCDATTGFRTSLSVILSAEPSLAPPLASRRH